METQRHGETPSFSVFFRDSVSLWWSDFSILHYVRPRLKFGGMKPKTLYLVLCVAGLLLPYSQFVPWVVQHGLNLPLFARELFANRIGAFFGMDVIVSAVALLVFTRVESVRLGIRGRWLVVVAVLTVGVSRGLPLFLHLRELELQQKPHAA